MSENRSPFDRPATSRPAKALPSRGKVLCIFADPGLVQSIEPRVVAQGYTLLRARHGMHGYWMAITGRPDVVITDVPAPEQESNYLLGCLSRNAKTSSIPIIAMVDAGQQASPQLSCLKYATRIVNRTIDPEELLAHATEMIEQNCQPTSSSPVTRRVDNTIDAYFSQLGHDAGRRSSPRPHLPVGDRSPGIARASAASKGESTASSFTHRPYRAHPAMLPSLPTAENPTVSAD